MKHNYNMAQQHTHIQKKVRSKLLTKCTNVFHLYGGQANVEKGKIPDALAL